MKRLLPEIKIYVLVGLAILLAYAFIWQRITLQNLSAEIARMEEEIRQLEKNKDYLKGEILYRSSLEQVRKKAMEELDMINSSGTDIIPYSDSLLQMVKDQNSSGGDGPPAFVEKNIQNGENDIIRDRIVK
ncbi:MAG TPA: hypothetical protein ENO22_07210 [candidate division Zixibacteria bacterium]|nr:hypothetical protein [candidate division Zixibacteria bacterium]HEQ99112.1 hypothetical protein [candidate division Zixibacteria bacterium]